MSEVVEAGKCKETAKENAAGEEDVWHDIPPWSGLQCRLTDCA
jgi:hypothetical protein